MQKPAGFDEAQEYGEFTPVNLGGHYAVVKQVAERDSSTGKKMIVVLFDFVKPDAQEGYFDKSFKNDTRDDKKWPFNGSKYIMVQDYQDPSKTSRMYKTFITCIQKSNNYEVQWGGNNWAQQFKNKRIGVVFGEEEHEYDGRISMRRLPKYFCRWDMVETAGIPEPRYINGSGPSTNAPAAPAPATGPDGFMNIPEGEEPDIPF